MSDISLVFNFTALVREYQTGLSQLLGCGQATSCVLRAEAWHTRLSTVHDVCICIWCVACQLPFHVSFLDNLKGISNVLAYPLYLTSSSVPATNSLHLVCPTIFCLITCIQSILCSTPKNIYKFTQSVSLVVYIDTFSVHIFNTHFLSVVSI